MDLKKLKALIDLVSDANISELEINEGDVRIRVVKALPAPVYALPPVQHTVQVAPSPVNNESQDVVGVRATADTPQGHIVTSPMVGTFYQASSPGAEPFVKVGDTVKAGQTLCIVEAMKLLNEIESDKAGVIKEILASNGQAVEYGQPLFLIA